MPVNKRSKKEKEFEVLGSSPTLTSQGLNMLKVLGSSPFTPNDVLGSSPTSTSLGLNMLEVLGSSPFTQTEVLGSSPSWALCPIHA